MQEGKLKPLYKGKCMEDLKKEFDTSFEGKSNKLLCKTLPKLLQKAESSRLAGDEENSYVFYMKYLSLVHYIKTNAKDEHCTQFLKTFNWDDVKYALDCAESLSQSLVKRYEQKKNEELEKERKRKETEAARREVEIEVKDNPKLTQPVTNGLPESSEVSVTCTELFTLLKSEKMKILIMDARPAASFKESQLKFPGRVISIPEEIVKKGSSAATLQRSLPEESKLQWKARGTVDLVVLLDWDTSASTFTPDSTLYVLKDILTRWDLEVKYKKNPVILEGGYEEWLLRYPAYTTNSQVKPPGQQSDSITDLLDDIEYPSLIEQALKPTKVIPVVDRKAKPSLEPSSSSLPTVRRSSKSSSSEPSSTSVTTANRSSKTSSSDSTSTSIPSVDRTAKKAAIQTYEERAQYMRKLLSIADSSLQLEEKRLKAEEEWDTLRMRREREAEEEMRFELQEREAQLLDNIQRLEKLQLEKDQENKSLRLLLDEYKRKEEERNKADSSQMKQEEELTAIIRSKEEEKQKISTKREEKFKERERRVAEERKNKPLNFPQLEKEQKERELKVQELQEQEKLARDKLEEDKKRAALRAAQEAKDERRDKGAYITRLKEGPSNSMKRSHSFPNIAQLDDDDDIADVHHKVPPFDRSIKPLEKPRPSEVRAARQRNFNPVYGSVGRGLTGLKNLGNTCYMNSIIQCLNNTAPLVVYFTRRTYLKDINHNNETHGEVAEEVAAVVQALWSGQYRSIAIRDLRNVVGQHRNQFQTTQQQDSSEFLTILMDWLHEDLKQENNTPKREVIHDQSEWERQWQKFYQDNMSVVVTLFYGQQKSTVCCLKCHEESVTFETFSNLTLPLPSDANRCSLEECVQLYLQGERISGWKCPSCKEPRDAVKKFDIIKLPPILVVHLKRFYVEGWCRKRQTFVDFPLDDFNMMKYIVNRDQKYTNFNLYGVSNHYGTMEGGHYTAYCKSSIYNKWYKFDDHEMVFFKHKEQVYPYVSVSNKIYILNTTRQWSPTLKRIVLDVYSS